MISKRTRDALAAAKARGKKLGGNRGVKLTTKARAAGRATLTTRAKARAAGATSLRGIAAALDARGIPTARGRGTWSAVQVARVLERL